MHAQGQVPAGADARRRAGELLLEDYAHFAQDADASASLLDALVELRGRRPWRTGRHWHAPAAWADVFRA
jgi:hypothetical protein